MEHISEGRLSSASQFGRLQRRLTRCIHELTRVADRLASSTISLKHDANLRQVERSCICLEVALDEASRWAGVLGGQLESEVAALSSLPVSTSLVKLEALIRELQVAT